MTDSEIVAVLRFSLLENYNVPLLETAGKNPEELRLMLQKRGYNLSSSKKQKPKNVPKRVDKRTQHYLDAISPHIDAIRDGNMTNVYAAKWLCETHGVCSINGLPIERSLLGRYLSRLGVRPVETPSKSINQERTDWVEANWDLLVRMTDLEACHYLYDNGIRTSGGCRIKVDTYRQYTRAVRAKRKQVYSQSR